MRKFIFLEQVLAECKVFHRSEQGVVATWLKVRSLPLSVLIAIIILLIPTLTFGQSFAGNYRAVFFNLVSEPKTIIVEFEVKQDNSLNGKIKLGDEVKEFTGTVDNKGKFEAIIEQSGNFTYKLKGKIDKNKKISLVQRNQIGSGLNKSVSENSLEGTFAKVAKPIEKVEVTTPQTKVELIDTGKSWLKIEHSNPFFGNDWTDFIAQINFGSNVKNTINTDDPPDFFNVAVKSQVFEQQTFRFAVKQYAPDKNLWKANELNIASYREVKGETRNSFMAGATLQSDPIYADGTIEIVKETDSQVVLKISNLKIKAFAKDGFVTLNGFIYADRFKK